MAGLDPAIHHCSKTISLLMDAGDVPSPLVGEGDEIERSEMKSGEGSLSAAKDPSSGADFVRAIFSHKGRREEKAFNRRYNIQELYA
jgi:hypothetical protein